ncbi:tRNA (adenosine(37)-N6)-threonylcarbamoyltransferase complex dimerization subunit type 1 TsaB [Paenibacillus alkalitolerans]|uniref:tRNA (adenosine(37)-N6)-threonylcarbamoyltransferase complex dimerization subunit type 1 TsaB n=1 Tax=Paenibacillus alkalitolerans TaxID=2799335 RepID=UPI001F28A768|nr:tRNA (adenosine(37)-N6)-threonylcarbamoyltransferase complex dimerization subunit type 1 TsaB [Paenibacillus alkalitolerans]
MDTSTAAMSVAIVEGHKVLGETQSLSERNHSVRLLPEIDELMKGCGVRTRDLRAVAIGVGPGSYTGVRIGVTVAKTFTWSLGLPLYAVSSLEALSLGGWLAACGASPTVSAPAWVVPALDARRGQAYTAVYAVDVGGAWSRVRADGIELFRGYAEQVMRAPERPGAVVFVVGDEDSFAGEVGAAAEGSGTVALRVPHAMRARDIAAVARRHGAAALVRDPHDLAPNYTQLAEAEAKLIARAPE